MEERSGPGGSWGLHRERSTFCGAQTACPGPLTWLLFGLVWLVFRKMMGGPQYQATTSNRPALYLQHIVSRTKKGGGVVLCILMC